MLSPPFAGSPTSTSSVSPCRSLLLSRLIRHLLEREIMKRHTSAILKAFWLGMIEFRSDFTSNWAGQEEAYDRRRKIAHRLTMRRFEPT